MEFKKSLLALGVIGVLTGCGSSDDDETKTPDTTTPPVSAAVTSDIKGVAAKGTFINAPVYFYKYVDGKAVKLTPEELGSASTMTDEKGQYSAQVKVEGLVKVEIGVSQDTNNPTFMICDAPVGCGQDAKGKAISFGEQVNMTVKDPTFTLTSLINAGKNDDGLENTANITPLTHFAAALAEHRGDMSAESITKAQSEIADTFGLLGALNELVPAKVEDQASLVDDDETDNLRYGLINAGIAQALFNGAKGDVGEMSARLSSAIQDIVAADGAFLASDAGDDDDAFEFTLEDILEGAEQATKQIIILIKKDPALAKNLANIADFELLITKFNNEAAKAKKDAGEDGRSKGVETDTTEGDAVAKAAAMVNDVRVFANLFDVAKTSGKEVQTQGDEFAQLVEDATDMVEAQAENFKLLSDVSEALAVIDSLRRSGHFTTGEGENAVMQTTFDLQNYLVLPGATGQAVIDEDGLVFTVTAKAGDEALSADIALTTNEGNTEYTLTAKGSMSNAEAEFKLNEGSMVSVTLNKALSVDEAKADFDLATHGIEAVKGEFKLDVLIAQKQTETVTNPVSFAGTLSAELVAVVTEELNFDYQYGKYREHETPLIEKETIALPEMISLSGNFSSLEGNQVGANLTVNVANAEKYQAAGFSYYGRIIENVASINFESANKAGVKNKAGDLIGTYTLLRNGESGMVAYEVALGDTTETVWSGIHNEQAYYLREEHTIEGDLHTINNTIYRIVANDYSYELQYANLYGNVSEFENGIVTVDEIPTSVDELYWSTDLYTDNVEVLHNLKGFVATPEAVSDLYSLLSLPALQQRIQVNNSDMGIAFALMPQAQPTIGQDTALSGRLVLEVADSTYDINVSEDGTESSVSFGPRTLSYSMDKKEDGGFVFVSKKEIAEEYTYTTTVTLAALQATDVGQPYFYFTDTDRVQIDDSIIPPPEAEAVGYYFNPIVDNGFNYIDVYTVFGDVSINESNQLIDADGNVVTVDNLSYYTQTYSVEDAVYMTSAYGAPYYSEYPAIQAMRNEYHSFEIEDKGYFNIGLYHTAHDIGEGYKSYAELLEPGATVSVPVYLEPYDTFELEDENTFLDINAVLGVNVVLGEYSVDLTLSGQRTELEQGKLELDVKYTIPGSEAQRTFVVEYDTATESLSAKNAEGVTLVLTEQEEAEEPKEGEERELGVIMVGEEQAATVVKRDGLVLIKYTDGAVETL